MRCGKLLTFLAFLLVTTPSAAQGDAWMAQVQEKLDSVKTYPRSAQIRGAEGDVIMRVAVDGYGMITGYEIKIPSQHDILNKEADRLLFRLGQFPAPPNREGREFDLTVQYKKQEK